MPNVLVTGANGFIGKALCRRMLTDGWNVRGAVRSFGKKTILPQGVDGVSIGNIGADSEWEPVLNGIDAVVHLAARVHVMDEGCTDPNSEYRKINVDGTKHLARIADTKNVRRFVYLSSIKVNGDGRSDPYTTEDPPAPVDPYGISKLQAEMVLREIAEETGLEVVILRPPLVYGPGVKANFLQLIKLINLGIPLPLAGIKNHRSLIFLGNLVDAVLTCILHPKAAGKTFLLSDGKDVSTAELIQKISSLLGRPSRLFSLSPDLLRFFAKMTGRSKAANRLLDSLTVDSSKICAELNWKPPFSIEEGLRETANWYLQAFG